MINCIRLRRSIANASEFLQILEEIKNTMHRDMFSQTHTSVLPRRERFKPFIFVIWQNSSFKMSLNVKVIICVNNLFLINYVSLKFTSNYSVFID